MSRLRVAIVGGGISGLSAAHRLQELAREHALALEIRLLEAAPRLGGQIRTEREGEVLLEGGPDQFVRHKPAALELCRRIGLTGELVQLEGGGSTQVVRDGQPRPLPTGLTMLGPTRTLPLLGSSLFTWRGKARMLGEPWVAARRGGGCDESLRSFVCRRFGRELFERVVEPIVGGIFTADSDRLSTEMTLPRLFAMERRFGSVTRGLRAGGAAEAGSVCSSLAGGMGRLVEALAARLPRESVRLGATVTRLARGTTTGTFELTVSPASRLGAELVVLACPAPDAARLVAPWDRALSADLSSVEQAESATVNLLYPAAALRRPLLGSGFFVGRSERLPILACSYVSSKFRGRAGRDRLLFRAYLGGARDPEVLERDDEDLARLAHRTVAALVGLEGEPLFSRTSRGSLPHHVVGSARHLARARERAARIPGLALCGGGTGAVGIPDCIVSGEEAACAALAPFLAAAGRLPLAAARS